MRYLFGNINFFNSGSCDMKKVLMLVCIAALMPGAASADIIGSWSYEDAGTHDRWVLTMTPTNGETMDGFDILVWDTQARGLFATGAAPTFKEGKDADTSFLLNETHTETNPSPPPPVLTVEDILAKDISEGNYWIGAAFSWSAGGDYDGGWSGPLELLEILVQKGSDLDPDQDLALLNAKWTGPALASVGGEFVPIQMGEIPEPSTLVLLACGLAGLIAYAWRKRR